MKLSLTQHHLRSNSTFLYIQTITTPGTAFNKASEIRCWVGWGDYRDQLVTSCRMESQLMCLYLMVWSDSNSWSGSNWVSWYCTYFHVGLWDCGTIPCSLLSGYQVISSAGGPDDCRTGDSQGWHHPSSPGHQATSSNRRITIVSLAHGSVPVLQRLNSI